MLKTNMRKSHLCIVLLLIFTSLGLLACNKKTSDEDFYISNLGIKEEDITSSKIVMFNAFQDGDWQLPAFWFDFEETADIRVYAPCDGIIAGIRFMSQEEKWEIRIRPSKNSKWNIILMHFKEGSFSVKNGDKVKMGDFLGLPDRFDSAAPNTKTIEIQITNENGYHYAPFAVFNPATKSIYEQRITALMSALETRYNDPNLYHEDEMVYPGCYYEKFLENSLRP